MQITRPAYRLRLILNKALWLTAAGIVVRGFGAIREIVFAGVYGVSRDTDLFVLSFTYATFIPTVVAGAIATALVAQFARMRVDDTLPSVADLTAYAKTLGICIVSAAAATYFLAPFLLPTFFTLSAAESAEAVRLARTLTPLAFTLIAAASISALLNSAKQFLVAGLAATATPVASIAAIALFGPRFGVEAAAWGMVAGGIFEVAILALTCFLRREQLFAFAGVASRPSQTMPLWRSIGFLALSSAIAMMSPVVDQVFLSRLQTGAVTTFNYASKVNSILIGLLGTAFSVAIYPYFSDLAAGRDTQALKRLAWQTAAFILPVTALASAVVFFFSYDIVDILFARGRFTPADTATVAHIQRVFSFQLVFYAIGLVAMRVLNAISAADFVLWISCLGVAINALLDWVFYESLGAAGIALSSVLTSVASLFFALLFIRLALEPRRWGSS